MKQTKRLLLGLLLSCLTLGAWAQDATTNTRPWVINVSSHFLNFSATNSGATSDYLGGKWAAIWGPTRISAAKSLSNSIALMPSVSLGTVDVDGYRTGASYWKADLGVQLSMANGKILPVYSRVEPYLIIAGGYASFGDQGRVVGSFGGGLNFWFSDGFGLNAQTTYDAHAFRNYWQNSVGLNFRIGSKGKRIVDADADGVVDELDQCPTEAGTAATNGCPDNDRDGIANKDDKCPDAAGTAATQGCPDADSDGVVDSEDDCPNAAGTAATKGCPDTDGDTVLDKDDGCPNEKGAVAMKGCPDSDSDGVSDKEDGCPSEKGTAALNGCPDRDGDGVADKEDTCPDQAGTVSMRGCPEISEEVMKRVEMAVKRIQFESGKAVLTKSSTPVLNTILTVMQENPSARFEFDGYTDNSGNPATNLQLSKDRMQAVVAFFTDKGIDTARLVGEGFGEANPLAPNNTAAGRAKNRRVAVRLLR